MRRILSFLVAWAAQTYAIPMPMSRVSQMLPINLYFCTSVGTGLNDCVHNCIEPTCALAQFHQTFEETPRPVDRLSPAVDLYFVDT